MTQTQKVVKYLAFALAALIIFGIVAGIYNGVAAIVSIFEGDGESIGEMHSLDLESEELPDTLYIDIAAAKLTVKIGDSLKVETNNKKIYCTLRSGTLKIEEKSKGSFSAINTDLYKSELILTLPKDLVLKKAEINSGAGRIHIEDLNAKDISLDLGAGEVVIDSITAENEAEISGGAGRIEIKDATFGEIDVDHGVGELIMTAKVISGGSVDCGVGQITLKLLGGKDNYYIDVEKGIGSIKIDGANAENDSTHGSGSSRIEINGGVGAVDIVFEK